MKAAVQAAPWALALVYGVLGFWLQSLGLGFRV